MRKIKSTALLGAFVAVASVGVISHEAHGSSIVVPNGNVPPIISKEWLPSPVGLQASIIPAVSLSGGSSITLTISGASFLPGSYTISGASCSTTVNNLSGTDVLTFSSCTLAVSNTYAIGNVSSSSFEVTVPTSSNSIVLSYGTNNGDASTSIIAYVKQQLTVTPNSDITYYIDPTSLSTFTNDVSGSHNAAANSVSILNNAYNNSVWMKPPSIFIISSTMIFSFSGIPSSVSSVSVGDTGGNSSTSVTPANGNASISFALVNAPFNSYSSDTITFTFSNSGNIQPGTIVLSSITGVTYNYTISSYINYPYLSTPQNFLSFSLAGTQLYIPDALAPDNNVINTGYITISLPPSATISNLTVLNNPSASCPVPSTSNGLLTSTSSTGVYYIDLSKLAPECTGLTPAAWQSGVPLVIFINNAVPTQVTADAYATFNNMLKRIPVDVLNASNSYANFNY